MKILHQKHIYKNTFAVIALCVGLMNGCNKDSSVSQSDIKVTDIDHTPSKSQTIGNCWVYAAASWAESLHLSATGETVNLSESYWTFWDWYYRIKGSDISEINTAGGWSKAMNLVSAHGYMLEGDFIPEEGDQESSKRQSIAEDAINEMLATGQLSDPASRTHENTLAALEEAFQIKYSEVESKIKPASSLVVGRTTQGNEITLKEATRNNVLWKYVSYPRTSTADEPSSSVQNSRTKILKRVMKALNDKKPVVMSVHVDFNGLNPENRTFEWNYLQEQGEAGRQGGHMIVLEDYTVDQVPDGNGGFISLGEGEMSDDLKAQALLGKLNYFVVKNSWGTRNGQHDGTTRFDYDYLNKAFDITNGEGEVEEQLSGLKYFILPAGY